MTQEPSGTATDYSPLRAALEAEGGSMKALTVLAPRNDPFRLDTPANHRDGEWLATTAAELGLGDRKIHLRGLHYMVIGRTKPDGSPYTNTTEDWEWLSGKAGKAARWLGKIPFGQIRDQRNTEPVVCLFVPPTPSAYLSTELRIEIPDDARPTLNTSGFWGTQPYKIVLVGEKSSLEDVLAPLARDYEADLYLPTGEISDTQAHRMAMVAANDGRPMVVLYFSDCDPAGWQMPISLGRKLQAHKVLLASMPEYEVHRVCLTPDQVGEYGLPSTPLKDSERRADNWRQAMGVDQTEIDALASLRRELLVQIARQALDGFYDHTLARRVEEYSEDWLNQARQVVVDTFGFDRLGQVRYDAEARLAEMRDEVRQLQNSLRIQIDEDDLPAIVLPEAVDPGGIGPGLLDSRQPFGEQCRGLIDSKSYEAL